MPTICSTPYLASFRAIEYIYVFADPFQELNLGNIRKLPKKIKGFDTRVEAVELSVVCM